MKRTISIILALLMIMSNVNVFAQVSNQETIVLNEDAGETYVNDKVASLIRQSEGKLSDDDEVHVLVRLKPEHFQNFGQMVDAKNLYTDDGIRRQLDFGKKAVAAAESVMKESGMNFDVIDEFTVLLLGFDTKVSFKDAKRMAAFDFIDSITIQKTIMKPVLKDNGLRFRMYSANEQSRDIIGNESVYSKYKGEGTIVAVIDSGFDVDHEAFYLTETGKDKAMYNEEKINELKASGVLKQGRYFSEKIPFGCNYFPESNPEKLKQRSQNSHGQHVAGTVAGNKVNVKYDGVNRELVGVAPEAQLALMRVFSDDNPGTDPSIYVKALEDCVKLKVTAVNMSIGSPAGDATQIDKDTTDALDRLAEAGCVVAIAAGNETAFGMGHELHPYKDNPDYGILGNPAAAEKSFAVASVENGFTVQDYFINRTANGEQKYALKWSSDSDNKMTEPEYDTEYDVVYVGLGREEDYTDNNYNVNGKLALIERGVNKFEEKVDIAIKHGAKAVLIYNHESGGDQFIGMANTWGKSVPVAALYYSTGMKLRNSAGKIIFKKGKVELANPLAGQISIFSSFGLSSDGSFKPEITAPGGNILSLGNNNTYNVQSGTSMATPHVAGGLALARSMVDARFPNLPVEEKWQRIRNLIMSSAQIHYDGDAATSPRRQGAGIMKLQNALNTKAILLGDKGETKLMRKHASNVEDLTFKIQNLSGENLTYKYKAVVVADKLNGDYYAYKTRKLKDIPFGEITVAANSTENISVTIDTSEFASELKEKMPNGYFVDGFVVFENDNEPEISIPFITFVGDLDKLNYVEKPIYDLDKEGKLPYYWNEKGTVHIAGLNTNEVPNNDFTHLYTYIEDKSEILGQAKDFTNAMPKFYNKRVISPNKDGYADALSASYTMLRSGHVSAFVYKLDANGNKQAEPIATLLEDEYMTKNFGSSMMPLSYSLGRSYPDANTTLEDGEYVLSLKAYSNKDNPANDVDMTFTVDTKKPTIENAKIEDTKLSFEAKDENGLREVIVKHADTVIEANPDGSYTIPEGAKLDDITVEAIDLGYNRYKTTAKMLKDGKSSSLKVNIKLNKDDPDFKLLYKIYDASGREFFEDNLAPGNYTLKITKPEEIYEIKKINDTMIDTVKFEDGAYVYDFTIEENVVTEVNIDIEKLDAYYVYFWVYGNNKDFKGVKLVNKDDPIKEINFEMTIGEDSPTYFGPKVFEKLVPYGKYKIVFDADMNNYKYDIKREIVNAEGKSDKEDANYDLDVNADSKLNNVGNISYSIDVNKKSMTLNIVGDNLDKSKFKLVQDGTDRDMKSLNTVPAIDIVNGTEVEPKDYLVAALPEEGYYADPPMYLLELGRTSKITSFPNKTKYDVKGDTVDVEIDIHKSEGFGSLKIDDNSEELGYKQEYIVEDLRSYFSMGGSKYTDLDHLPEGNYIVRPLIDEKSSHITNDTFKFVTVKADKEATASFAFEKIPEPAFDGFAMIVSEGVLKITAKELSSGDVQELEAMPDEGKVIYFLMGNKGIYELTVNGGDDEGYDYPKYVMVIGESVIEIKKAYKLEEDEDYIKALEELHKLIDEAKAIDETKYTEDSVRRLKETVAQVDKGYDNLHKLKEAVALLKEVMDKLEEKHEEPKPEPNEPTPEPYEPYEPEPRPYRPHRPAVETKPLEETKPVVETKPIIPETKKDFGIITEYPVHNVTLKDLAQGPEGDAIRNLVSYGVINGMGNGKFEGKVTITKAMLTKVFMAISEDKEIDHALNFKDITSDKWYTDPVMWAASKGIINGYTDGTFRPEKKVSRQEFCVMLMKLLNKYGIELKDVITVNPDDFKDAPAWSKDAMLSIKKAGLIIVEAEGKYGPESELTREELATALNILINYVRSIE